MEVSLALRNLTLKITPEIIITIIGIIATEPTTPNASVKTLPPVAVHAPITKGSAKVTVIGPLATPPLSNAMPVKILGAKNIRIKQIPYIGNKTHHILMPVSTLKNDTAIANPTPIQSKISMLFLDRAPLVISLTCLVKA